jgi:hypothetical protein
MILRLLNDAYDRVMTSERRTDLAGDLRQQRDRRGGDTAALELRLHQTASASTPPWSKASLRWCSSRLATSAAAGIRR